MGASNRWDVEGLLVFNSPFLGDFLDPPLDEGINIVPNANPIYPLPLEHRSDPGEYV